MHDYVTPPRKKSRLIWKISKKVDLSLPKSHFFSDFSLRNHTLNWVGAEGGTDFSENSKISKKNSGEGQFAICPPGFGSQAQGGGAIFFAEGAGGPDPGLEAEGGTWLSPLSPLNLKYVWNEWIV